MGARFRLGLHGGFRLTDAAGLPLDISSRKGAAMLAMLATAPHGERTRDWLVERLWGSRARAQGRQSLRREVMGLRALLGEGLVAGRDRLALVPGTVELVPDWPVPGGALLDGLEIAGEPGFAQWRSGLRVPGQRAAAQAAPTASPGPEGPDATADSLDFDRRPILEVRALANETGDAGHDPLCSGLGDDLIDRLSRLRWLPVIARNELAGAGGMPTYVLFGSIRRGVAGLRHVARLVDAETGVIRWTRSTDLPPRMGEDFLLELVSGLAASIGEQIDLAEQRRALGKSAADLAVTDLIWLGRWHYHQLSPAGMGRARGLFREAIDREPGAAEAHLNHAWVELFDAWRQRSGADAIQAGLRLAENAAVMEPTDSRAFFLAGAAHCWLGRTEEAESLLRHAIAINPSCFAAYAQLGSTLYLDGRPAEAIRMMTCATRLSPQDQKLFMTLAEIGMACLMLDDAGQALAFARQAIVRRPGYWYAHVVRVAALNRLGRHDEAMCALADLYDTKCRFEPAFIDWLPFRDRRWNAMLRRECGLLPG